LAPIYLFAKIPALSLLLIMPDEFGEHLTRDQRPFLYTETDPADLQVHVGAFSLQFNPLIFYRVQFRILGLLHVVLSDTVLC